VHGAGPLDLRTGARCRRHGGRVLVVLRVDSRSMAARRVIRVSVVVMAVTVGHGFSLGKKLRIRT